MNNQMTAKEVVQTFCRQWFEQRDADGAAAFLAEEVDFVGTGVGVGGGKIGIDAVYPQRYR